MQSAFYKKEVLMGSIFSRTGAVVGIVVLLSAVAVFGAWKYEKSRLVPSIAGNLLTEHDWSGLAGASTTPEGLLILPLGRTIVHQDGSVGQPKPPVSLVGPHLEVLGDFSLTARMNDIDERGVIRLYGRPPVIYDQWRQETGSIEVTVATSTIVVRVWDGTAANAIDMRTYPHALTESVAITIAHIKDTFVLYRDGHVLGSIPDHGIFESGEVWFGFDAGFEDEWLLNALFGEAQNGGAFRIVDAPDFTYAYDDPNALRNLSEKHPRKLRIGAAISYSELVTDKDYRALALGEFNMLTPENGMKPQFVHPSPELYSFTEMDTLVDIAHKNDMLVHGHALVYHKSSPLWMSDAPLYAREKILREHVTEVAGHFKGKVKQWDVVNEPLSNKKAAYKDKRRGLDDHFWYEAMGEKYIDIAFFAAHEADPDAELYVNDYGLERDGERWDALLSLLRRLQARGVPIHGVGFESHIYGDGDYSEYNILRAHMQTLEDMGLKVRISEIDVVGEDPKAQVEQYRIALDACLSARNCTGYSTWGITDLYGSTTRSDRYPLVYGGSLLFETDYKPKPAYAALQERLKQKF